MNKKVVFIIILAIVLVGSIIFFRDKISSSGEATYFWNDLFCDDQDGLNPSIKGISTLERVSSQKREVLDVLQDRCDVSSEKILIETYCNPDKQGISEIKMECAFGCLNGVCDEHSHSLKDFK